MDARTPAIVETRRAFHAMSATITALEKQLKELRQQQRELLNEIEINYGCLYAGGQADGAELASKMKGGR